MSAVVPDAPRGPGRPRVEEFDGLILDAALAIIDEGGDVTVSAVVARSGVSRAALYRRWPSLTALIAAALDVGRTVPPEFPEDGDLREAVLDSLTDGASAHGYSEHRFRQRMRLVMSDRTLQKAYWSAHVARRRLPLERALRVAADRGELRPDIDVEACFDAIAGAVYYQLVVRGDRLDAPETRERLRSALDVIWRGMTA